MVAKKKGREVKKKKETREKKLAWVCDAELVKEYEGLQKPSQKLKKRQKFQQKEGVEVVYIKRPFVKRRS
jgi:hypothetical protein